MYAWGERLAGDAIGWYMTEKRKKSRRFWHRFGRRRKRRDEEPEDDDQLEFWPDDLAA